ncbi:MAG TPA: glycosyltransferase family 39 protein [Acetobacteraceae bacterium]|nr:glycosyltransferase family 39 protein [Acetobacteraceae bacterium]
MELRRLGDAGLARPLTLGLSALTALTLLRLVMAAVIPLAPDEAYYWVWSRHLQPGYLDAPPMVAVWVQVGTLIAGHTALGVRLLGPLSAALGSVLLWRAGEALLPGRHAGLVAAALLNATLLFGVGAVIMTPDTPLLFFWTCALWACAMFVRDGNGAWLVAAGVFAGLALTSKYTAALLVLGIALWLIMTPSLRRRLLQPAPWWGALFGAVAFAPVIEWNRAHGWASFVKQGGRVADWQREQAARFLGELIGGQVGLATPLVFLLCVAGIALAVRMAWRRGDPVWTLLAALTVPPIVIFVQHALGDRVQGNWPAIIYPAAAIAAAGLDGWLCVRLRAPAVALGLVIVIIAYVQAVAAPIPLPVRIDPTAFRLAGWAGLAAQVEAARIQTGAAFVASDEYGEAAELAWLLPPDVPVIGVEPRWALFDLPRLDLPRPALTGPPGILVRSARRGGDMDRGAWAEVQEIGPAVRTRDTEVVERYRIYRVIARQSSTPKALLPRW